MYVRTCVHMYVHAESFRGQVAGVFSSVKGGATNQATSRLVCCVGVFVAQWFSYPCTGVRVGLELVHESMRAVSC